MVNLLLENIKPCLKTIEENTKTTEENRKVASQNISLLANAAFFKAFQPKTYGGIETSISEYVECVVELAKHCASTAWVASLLANHSHVIGLFDPKLQDEIWKDSEDALVCSSVAPLGKHKVVKGGVCLSGEFGWSSGSNHADWAVLGYRGVNDTGQSGPCFAVVPKSDYVLNENWSGEALKGTGSHTILLNDVFVPEYRIESLLALNFGLSKGFGTHKQPIFNAPFSPIFSLGFSAVAVGVALKFIELFKQKTMNRLRAYNNVNVAQSSVVQVRIGESTNQVHAALTLLRNDWREMDDRASSDHLPSMDDIMNWRSRQAYAIKMTVASVDRLFAAAGGGAWMASNEMQKLFRDIHIIASHAQTDYDIAAETFGRYLLELPMDAKHY